MKAIKKNLRGTILALMAVLLPVLLAFSCLALDTWHLYLVRNEMQIAADAAALAAAISLNKVTPGNTSTAVSLAKTMTGLNNYTHGSNNVTVTVSIPPGDPYGTSPSYASNSSYARVQISQIVTLYFGQIIGTPTMTVTANAVGGPGSPSFSILTLATSGAGSINMSGSGIINAISGSVGVNSSDGNALAFSGSPKLTASTINVVGGSSSYQSSFVTGTLNTHTSATSNPFSGLTLPKPSSCTKTNYSIGNSNSATLSPGTYCGGISIQGSAHVTLNPGTYILNGGGLNIGNGGTLTGTGVTFYNTGASSGSKIYGPFNIAGSGVITLSAPTSGTYQGMLFIQDPLNTQTASISNGATGYMAGNMYIPNASLNFSGSGIMTQPIGILVAKNIAISGSASIKTSTQYGGGGGGSIGLFE